MVSSVERIRTDPVAIVRSPASWHPADLGGLAERKAILRTRIALRRRECEAAADRIEWIIRSERARLLRWTTAAGLVAAVARRWIHRREHRRFSMLRRLLRWTPLAMQAWRLIRLTLG